MKVSIIVVAYNIEKFIGRCLSSIVNQTYKNIEIIIVNDGSKDNTLNEIKKFIDVDKRIILLDQNNSGVMVARENGYKLASGEYILFVDGDDWLKNNAIERLVEKATETESDIVCYKFLYIDEDKKERLSHQNNEFITFDKMTNDEFLRAILLSKVIPSIWSKFIKLDFIKDNNIKINNNLQYAEDLAFSVQLAINKPNVSMCNEHLYYYFQRQNSVTKLIDNKILDIDKAIKNIRESLEENSLYYIFLREFEYLCFLQNYFDRINIISNKKSKYGKKIYLIWKKYDISLIQNSFIKNRINKESIGFRLILYIFNINYNLGILYCNFREIIFK